MIFCHVKRPWPPTESTRLNSYAFALESGLAFLSAEAGETDNDFYRRHVVLLPQCHSSFKVEGMGFKITGHTWGSSTVHRVWPQIYKYLFPTDDNRYVFNFYNICVCVHAHTRMHMHTFMHARMHA